MTQTVMQATMDNTVGTDMTKAQLVAKLDLEPIMARVAAETGLPAATLARAEMLYRQFLILKADNPGRIIPPPKLADLVWHEHIVFTKRYIADCEMVFGTYLHHSPAENEEQDMTFSSLYHEVTVAAYKEAFGIDLYQLPQE